MLLEGYRILKVLNNNVVLTVQSGKEKIVFSKGIGYNKKSGDMVSGDIPVEKVFTLEDSENNKKFNQLVANVDSKIVGLCEEIIYMIDREFGGGLDEQIHTALTDHIAFTLMRLKEKDEIANPFLIETETLYKDEYEVARKAVDIIEKRTGIKIPEGEIGFITLHIHSARNRGKLSNAIKMAFLSNSIIEMIEDEFNISIDRKSLDYARFVIHLKFAMKRIMNKTPIKNGLLEAIKKEYKDSYLMAEKISGYIEDELKLFVPEDETGYIAIYVEKLKNAF